MPVETKFVAFGDVEAATDGSSSRGPDERPTFAAVKGRPAVTDEIPVLGSDISVLGLLPVLGCRNRLVVCGIWGWARRP